MVRFISIATLILGLAACQSDDAPEVSQAAISTSNPNDTRVAKQVFGYIPDGSNQTPEAIGGYAKGCQAGAVLVDYVQDLSRFAATQPGWDGLYVGDLSQPRGGPMLTGQID